MRRKVHLIITAGCLIVFLVALGTAYDVLVFEISLPDQDGEIVYTDIASSTTKLGMRYIHSVERTPVQGWFALAPQGGFLALRTMSKGSGTGLPNVVHTSRVAIDPDWMVVDEGRTHIPHIPFYYLPLNDLHISLGKHKVDLSQVPPGSRLLISNEKMPLAKALWNMLPL